MMTSYFMQAITVLLLLLPEAQGSVRATPLIEQEGLIEDDGLQGQRRLQDETIEPALIQVPDETTTFGNDTLLNATLMDRAAGGVTANAVKKSCSTIPSYSPTSQGLLIAPFDMNQNCYQLGYDFGYKIDGCQVKNNAAFDSLTQTVGYPCSSFKGLGSVTVGCSNPDSSSWRNATVTPTVDATLIMKGGTGGNIYTGLKAGKTYNIDIGPPTIRAISHMEFCFHCDGLQCGPTSSPTTAAPTTVAPTTIKPTPAPTLAATTAAPTTIKPTPAPTLAATTAAPTTIKPTPAPTLAATTAAPTTIKPTTAPNPLPTTAPTPLPTTPPTPLPTTAPTPLPTTPPTPLPTPAPTPLPTPAPTPPPTTAPTPLPTTAATTPPVSSVNGDPHFKTWKGEKFDYHGECDLLLVDNPSFGGGIGMMIQVRTTRIQYFSYIEKIGIKIGDDVLEFANDVANVKLNGVVAAPKPGKYKTFMAGKYEVVRYKKSVIVRLDNENKNALTYSKANHTKIDLIARKVGWPTLKLNAGAHDLFEGSVGLLGDYATGKKLARDGVTEINDPTDFAMEWQVRDTEPMLFDDAREPQYPAKCKPPAKMMGNRLGISHMKKDAEKVCAAWKEDIEDCIFDVLASRDLFGASDADAAAE